MTTSHRYMTSLLMTTIYLLIVMTPLAPLAMQSKVIAHAVTGECSGDCKVDGCSLERSAAHSCCCWQKKKHETADAHLHQDSEVCSIPPAHAAAVSEKKGDCCDAPVQNDHTTGKTATSAFTPAPKKAKPVTISSTPCGADRLFTFLSSGTSQHLPFYFSEKLPSPEQTTCAGINPERLTSRYTEPPDPPPIISSAS